MQQPALVAQQFGNTASAYLTSTVHAQGADLAQLRDIAASLPKRPVVLDLGCGAGHASFAVAPVAESVTAYDLSPQMLEVVADAAHERGHHNLGTQQGNVAALPFIDSSFCMVVTRFSAHHWLDVPAALREVRRVLKPNGAFVVIDITAPEVPLHDTTLQAVELLRDGSHVRDYRPSEWTQMLADAGFASEPGHSWKLQMKFDEWTARMRTPADRVTAIRSLLRNAPEETRHYFAVEADDSFTIDATMFKVAPVNLI
ncbi:MULTISPECIES: class I SAM-dependent methyltransferase [unclassified Duganella]|uniref:class I SAM-dependent methyltransferase n=1 Tax=unclassified Duganella TaxID=2636909 RepID=UPI00088FACDF|nr:MULTISPECIES: class I SAM-dependent methyltransferase [unclassified Duganella]SDG66654.1 Ubiquinone/menaquinone biosynthesis C-methylase UbiE [Duganella sp. OV458]SDJ91917.1 Ubiquinone/menaquinone biosynthesis C-methylase UbiE [Duganella sp. OV510]